MAGYQRQSAAEIQDTLTINAVDLNNEFNALVAAFNNGSGNTAGHKHDGTAANGPVISILGDSGLGTPLNKINVDTTNKHLEFNINVSGASVEQFRLQDGAIVPITTNDIDLGTSTLQFKDGYFDGNVTLDGLVIGSATALTDVDTNLSTVSANDDTLASAKAIKTYVDAQVGTSDTLAEVLAIGNTTSGTNIQTTTTDKILFRDSAIHISSSNDGHLNLNADTEVQITSPYIDLAAASVSMDGNLDVDGTIEFDALSGTGAVTVTDIADEDNMSSNSATKLATQQSIKSYVDTAVATVPTGDITSVVAGTGMTGGGTTGDVTLNAIGGVGITVNANDITIDNTVATLTGSQILSAKTLTSPVLNGTLSGSAFLDEDNFSSDSATAVASQQSIKAYIAANASSVTPNSTTTFLNKTIDANGTGNSITNLEVADLASGVLDTNLASVSASDNTLASAKAIKAYVDGQAHSDVTASSTTTFTNKTIDVDATGNSLTNIANANIKSGAALDATKIADGTVTSTEFQFINSLSSNAQTQIDTKQATINSSARLNANLVGDGSVDNTEFGYINGVTSAIQTQINTVSSDVATKASAGFAVAMAIAL